MSRKERFGREQWYDANGVLQTDREYITEYIDSDDRRFINGVRNPWKPCLQVKEVSRGSAEAYGWHSRNVVPSRWFNAQMIPWFVRNYAYVPLDFQENNSFEIIPFLVDLDDTLAMFGKKFAQSLTYGGLTWGVLPFISDVKSLAATVGDILSGIHNTVEKMSPPQARRVPFKVKDHDGYYSLVDIDGTITMTGSWDVGSIIPDSPEEIIQFLLDEIGFHPDLKTIWDVIPLSFVADYFLPVGDVLESVHPRGWFRPTIGFYGGWSCKANVSLKGNRAWQGSLGKLDIYYRSEAGDHLVLPTRAPMIHPEWSAPSWREIFNTWYLTKGR